MAEQGNVLNIKITAEIDDLTKELNAAEKEVKGFGDKTTKSFEDAAKSTKPLSKGINTSSAAMRKLNNATGGVSTAMVNVGKAATKTGAAMRSALIASGIGALLVALTLIIQHWDSITGATKRANEKLKIQKKLTEDITRELQKQKELQALNTRFIDVATEEAVLRAKIAGASEKEIFDIKQKGLQDAIDIAEQRANETDRILKNSVTADRDIYKKAEKDQIEAFKNLGEARSKLLLANLNEEYRIKLEGAKRSTELEVKTIQEQVSALGGALTKGNAELIDLQSGFEAISFVDTKKLTDDEVALAVHLARLKDMAVSFAEEVNDLIVDSISYALADMGNAIGAALAEGGNVIEAAGNSLLASLGGFLSEFGAMLIKYGVAQAALATGLLMTASMNPYGMLAGAAIAIAAGLALSVIGGAISSQAANPTGGGGNVQGYSGADTGASTSSVTYGNSGAGSGGGTFVFEIAGTKLIGVIQNTLNRNRSLGGQDLITSI